jgi:hypothetical protein
MNRFVRGVGAFSLMAIGACHSLDISNPNEPDAKRALADPKSIEALAAGAMQTWFNAYTGLRSAGVLSTQARTYSSSWNNGWLNYHSGIDLSPADTVTSPATWTRNTRNWQNDPTATVRTSIDAFWGGGLDESSTNRPGFYSSLAAANNVLIAIRTNGTVITNASNTKRAETVAAFMQGASLMMLSLNYDKGYVVDEKSDLTTLAYVDRKVLRDSAVSKLNQAATLAAANTFTTDVGWTNGIAYSSTSIAKIAKTMAAMTLAWYPRDDTENATQVNWAQVATYASAGVSSGTPVDFSFQSDGYVNWISELMYWFNGMDGGRVSTRVAHFMDPAREIDPYRLGVGSIQPVSPDKRLGDGSFGDAALAKSFGTVVKTANGGTDFAWLSQGEIFRSARGFYHQSNIGHMRYDASRNQNQDDVYGGFGIGPIISATQNDLIWAEALLRQGGGANAVAAANLIDKSRVGRGGLTSATLALGTIGSDADGPCMTNGRLAKNGNTCSLWSMLLYEYELELLGLGPAPFYNQRHLPVLLATAWERVSTCATAAACTLNPNSIFNGPRYIQGLLPGTPREMPVPYKELGVKGEALYTYGGSSPAKGPVP